MAPRYKLTFFNDIIRGEPIRMLLSYGGIPFEDVRIDEKDWPKIKPTTPLGKLPILEIDGKKVTQAYPICRYLANIVNLAGNDNEENFEIDAAVEMVYDLMKISFEFKFEPDEDIKKKILEKVNDRMSVLLGALEKNAEKNGGYIAINRISWADIIFITAYEDIRNIFNTDILTNYPNLQEVKKNLQAVKNLKNWIKNRPKIPTFLYDLRNDL